MQNLAKVLLILSPLADTYLFGYIYNRVGQYPGNEGVGIHFLLIVVFGIPFIAITGLLVSFFTRNMANEKPLSIYGYVVSALLITLAAAVPIFVS